MKLQETIEQKLASGLQALHLEVENESHMHSVPTGSESHFKVTVVSGDFDGKALLARHRMVNEILAEELAGPVHALAVHTLTPEEWRAKGGQVPPSPACMGGSRQQAD